MEELTELLKTNLKSLINEGEFIKVIEKIKEIGMEKFSHANSFIGTLINQLGEKLNFHLLVDLLLLIAKSKNENLLEYEFKAGMKIAVNHNHYNDFFDPLFFYIKKKTTLDEYFISDILNNTCFNSNHINNQTGTYYIEKCFEIILLTIEKNRNLSSSFWELIVSNSLKINHEVYFKHFVTIFPVKQFFNEKMWRNIISTHMNDYNINHILELFVSKMKQSSEADMKCQFFENIFNIFIEELSNSYENIELNKIENVYNEIIGISSIAVKESSLEKFLTKIVTYKISYERLTNILINTTNSNSTKSNKLGMKKLIEKMLRMFYKKGDIFSIYNILRLIKLEKLGPSVKYEEIEIDDAIIKELIPFLVEHTEIIKYEESNQEYEELKKQPKNFYSRSNSNVDDEILNKLAEIEFQG